MVPVTIVVVIIIAVVVSIIAVVVFIVAVVISIVPDNIVVLADIYLLSLLMFIAISFPVCEPTAQTIFWTPQSCLNYKTYEARG